MRTNIPVLTERLMPKLSDYTKFKECDKKFKQLQKSNYDSRHIVYISCHLYLMTVKFG